MPESPMTSARALSELAADILHRNCHLPCATSGLQVPVVVQESHIEGVLQTAEIEHISVPTMYQ